MKNDRCPRFQNEYQKKKRKKKQKKPKKKLNEDKSRSMLNVVIISVGACQLVLNWRLPFIPLLL